MRRPLGCMTFSALVAAVLVVVAIVVVAAATGNGIFSPGALSGVARGAPIEGVSSHAELQARCDACHATAWSRATAWPTGASLAIPRCSRRSPPGAGSTAGSPRQTTAAPATPTTGGSTASADAGGFGRLPPRPDGLHPARAPAPRPGTAASGAVDCHPGSPTSFTPPACLACHEERDQRVHGSARRDLRHCLPELSRRDRLLRGRVRPCHVPAHRRARRGAVRRLPSRRDDPRGTPGHGDRVRRLPCRRRHPRRPPGRLVRGVPHARNLGERQHRPRPDALPPRRTARRCALRVLPRRPTVDGDRPRPAAAATPSTTRTPGSSQVTAPRCHAASRLEGRHLRPCSDGVRPQGRARHARLCGLPSGRPIRRDADVVHRMPRR